MEEVTPEQAAELLQEWHASYTRAKIVWRKEGRVGIDVGKGMVAVIDEADYGVVRPYSWHTNKSGNVLYAMGYFPGYIEHPRRKARNVPMHRIILGITDPKLQTDHIDGNGLNNTRANLRACTSGENLRNSRPHKDKMFGSKYKGCHWISSKNGWRALIMVNGKRHYLGIHKTEEAAARAYDAAALKLQGQYARLNFPAVAA